MLLLVFIPSSISSVLVLGGGVEVDIPSNGTIVPQSELMIFQYPFKSRVLDLNLISHQAVDQLSNEGFKAILTTAPCWNLSHDDQRAYKDFIDYASAKGIKVYGVTLEDNVFISRDDYIYYTPKFFESVIKLNKNFGFNFVGYIVDIEPHTLPDWDINQELYLKRLIEISSTLHVVANAYSATFSMTLPYWYQESVLKYDSRGLNLFDTDFLVLMMYYGTAGHILEKIDELMVDLITPSTIAININPETPDPHISYEDFRGLVEELHFFPSKYPQLIGLSAYESSVIVTTTLPQLHDQV